MQAYGNLFQGRQFVTYISRPATRSKRDSKRASIATPHISASAPTVNTILAAAQPMPPNSFPRRAARTTFTLATLLPDTLSGFLSGSPFAYTVASHLRISPTAQHIGPAAINRNNFSFFVQDTWKITAAFTLDYGLRWDLYTPISERAHRTSTVPHRERHAAVCHQSTARLQNELERLEPRLQTSWQVTRKLSGARRRQPS